MSTRMPLVSVLLCCVALCPGCHKQRSYYLTRTSHDYFVDFQNGSYWVYRNEADPSDVDTFTLLNRTQEMILRYAESPADGDYDESVHYALYSSKTRDTLSVDVNTNQNIDGYSLRGSYRGLEMACGLTLIKNSEQFAVNSSAKDTLKTYKSYTLNGKNYTDVFTAISVYQKPYYAPYAPYYSFAKQEGLIGFGVFRRDSDSIVRFGLTASNIIH